MSSYTEKLMNMQKSVESIEDLKIAIAAATTLKQINEVRMACVKFMKQDSSLLKLWQDKFWSLKRCGQCGTIREGLE